MNPGPPYGSPGSLGPRPPRKVGFSATVKNTLPSWRHVIDSWIQFGAPGDEIRVPDAECKSYAVERARLLGKSGLVILTPEDEAGAAVPAIPDPTAGGPAS